jgi:hypothetical protein
LASRGRRGSGHCPFPYDDRPEGFLQAVALIGLWGRRRPSINGVGTVEAGPGDVGQYLDSLALEEGTLLVFDQRRSAPPLPERVSKSESLYQERRINVLRL